MHHHLYDEGSYLNVELMMTSCPKCAALHVAAKRNMRSPQRAPRITECGQKGTVNRSSYQNPRPLPQRLSKPSDIVIRRFRTNICANNDSLAIGCVRAERVSCSPSCSSSNPPTTVRGHVYHLLDALLSPSSPCLSFQPVYLQHIDYT